MVVGKITKVEAAVAIAEELTVVTELDVEKLGSIEHHTAPGIKIILARAFERLVESRTGHRTVFRHPFLYKYGRTFLVFGEIGMESDLFSYQATSHESPRIEIIQLFTLVVVDIIDLQDRVD